MNAAHKKFATFTKGFASIFPCLPSGCGRCDAQAKAAPVVAESKTNKIGRLCVFCGSSPVSPDSAPRVRTQPVPRWFASSYVRFSHLRLVGFACFQGKKPQYMEAARRFGEEMVKRNIGLVYGGGTIGLMGAVARAVHGAGLSCDVPCVCAAL